MFPCSGIFCSNSWNFDTNINRKESYDVLNELFKRCVQFEPEVHEQASASFNLIVSIVFKHDDFLCAGLHFTASNGFKRTFLQS